ncbi:MAG: cytochrome c class I [Gammaproteobacteria bacterium RBG_16_57_12]|nr:MAG: cytochrome c class I [Gammaproteobacteria bacterium RBG_16_57_12]
MPGAGPSESSSAASRHERGRAIYNFRCYYCHGYSGDAKTLAARFLNPAPRSFVATAPDKLSRASMLDAIMHGRTGSAMMSFQKVLDPGEIELVADFVRKEFMVDKAPNTRYHTKENGWPQHERYAIAYPFATGEIPIDAPWADLTPEQQAGLRLFMRSCVSCHDRSEVLDSQLVWKPRPVSYPRNNYSHKAPRPDAVSSASIFGKHDVPPTLTRATSLERQGEQLFQVNCAFCHGGDGTGKNWIGSFMDPPARDLTDPAVMSGMTRQRLYHVLMEGLPGTKMPAWKSVLNEDQIDAIIAYVAVAFYRLPEK